MGYMSVFGLCASCKQIFSFNAHRVPSVRVNGVREPVCRSCVERSAPARIANGLEPIVILPGAYDPSPE